MKKLIVLVLCMMITVMPFSACAEKEPEGPVTITIMTEAQANQFYYLNEKLKAIYGGEIQIDFEKLRSDQNLDVAEREAELQRVRTEIMAGEGPDIFYLPTSTAMMFEGVFTNVAEAMNNGIFLPLDDYIAESEIFDPEDYIEPILEAGKADKGQMVVPLVYDIPLILVEKSFADKLGKNTITLDELLNCGDERTLARAAGSIAFDRTAHLIPGLADYSTGNLTMSEDELKIYFDDISDVVRTGNEVENFDRYAYYELGEKYGVHSSFNEYMLSELSRYYTDQLEPLIITNNKGEYTAKITGFAAINANTEHPEEAFKVLEIIAGGYKTFGESSLRPSTRSVWNNKGIAAVKEAYGETDLIDVELVKFIEESVVYAEFACDLDSVLAKGRSRYSSAVKDGDIKGAEKVLANTYSELKMNLAE